jgi:hypothetical protein
MHISSFWQKIKFRQAALLSLAYLTCERRAIFGGWIPAEMGLLKRSEQQVVRTSPESEVTKDGRDGILLPALPANC